MESKDLPLYTTLEINSLICRVYACTYLAAIIGLVYYRIVYMPSEGYWPWIVVFVAELGFAYGWILEHTFRWSLFERKVFPERLSQRFESDLPPVDIFICTADPIKEPPLTVINTVLSALALDYPVRKLSCYVSDDGGSPLTFYALLEASRFAKIWVPFCYKYSIQDRCPEAYFSNAYALENENMSFTREWKKMKEKYLELKNCVNNVVEMGSVPEDKQKQHKGFNDWSSGSTLRDHPSIVQTLLQKGEDRDVQGNDLPNLIYVSREKRPGIPHNYKAGALNVLIRVSGVMSNAPFILTLDCDMYANNSEALRQAMCFFMDPKTGQQFAYVQFPQCFHGITKNDIYSNIHLRFRGIQLKGMDGIDGPLYGGTGCIHRRDALCGIEQSHTLSTSKAQASPSKMMKYAGDLAKCACEENTLWGKEVGMIYGCAVEDVLTGFVIQSRGWKSIYCSPSKKAFLGGAPVNLNDTLIQNKRWTAGFLEFFLSKFCPYVYGIQRTRITQRMCYGWLCLMAPSSLYILCYGLVPALFILNGVSLFPKASNPWFILFASLVVSAYGYSLIEFLWIGGSFKSWWNEQRMWMIKGVSAYPFALFQVACKMIGVSEVGFELTNKVVDSEAAKRYEAEMFEFGVASPLFVPPATLALINLISLIGGVARILREGYPAFESMALQLFLCSFIVINSCPILEAMFMRKDKGRIPTSISIVSILVAVSACSVASIPIPSP
jgi:cellulose synthase/poly-beta-1,6-N-acetylglucosamine synthase-like glycosyltransferase